MPSERKSRDKHKGERHLVTLGCAAFGVLVLSFITFELAHSRLADVAHIANSFNLHSGSSASRQTPPPGSANPTTNPAASYPPFPVRPDVASGQVPPSALPRMYIYSLPPELTNCTLNGEDEGHWWQHGQYGGEIKLPGLIRNTSAHYTTDPEQADYFWVPTVFHCRGTRESPATIALQAIDYIRSNFPYWGRNGGTDHIWVYTQDHGYCLSGRDGNILTENWNSTIVTHFGRTVAGGAECLEENMLWSFGRCAGWAWPPTSKPCLTPGKDVVVPEMDLDQPRHRVWPGEFVKEKGIKFFFAGRAGYHDPYNMYSQGVRQAIMLLNTTSGFVIRSEGYGGYRDDLRRSWFCLAPAGNGWGDRFKIAVLNGCIPWVVQDNMQIDWEGILPHQDFAMRTPQSWFWKLPQLVDQALRQPERVRAMQEKLACAWRFWVWDAPEGLALEALLCALRLKLLPAITPRVDWQACRLDCT